MFRSISPRVLTVKPRVIPRWMLMTLITMLLCFFKISDWLELDPPSEKRLGICMLCLNVILVQSHLLYMLLFSQFVWRKQQRPLRLFFSSALGSVSKYAGALAGCGKPLGDSPSSVQENILETTGPSYKKSAMYQSISAIIPFSSFV